MGVEKKRYICCVESNKKLNKTLMKKTLMTIAVVLATAVAAVAQNPQEIYEKFKAKTNVEAYEQARKGRSELIEANVAVGPMSMPIKMVVKHDDPAKFRMDMSVQGQDILIVFDGEAAYMTVQGQTQKITDPEQIKQLAPTNDITSQLGPKVTDFSKLKYVGAEGECDVLSYDAGAEGNFTLYINKTTNLLDKMKIETNVQGQSVAVETELKEYKSFASGEVLFPTVMEMNVMGQVMKMEIVKLELDFPTAPWMFAAPVM